MADTNRLERRVGMILRGGVVVAALVIIAGLVLLARHGDPALATTADAAHAFTQAPEAGVAFAKTPRAVLAAAARAEAGGVIQLGLLILMTLPVVRVAATVLLFMAEREVAMALIAFSVLVLLTFGALD